MEGKNLKLANLEGGKTYYIELNLSQHNNPIWIQRWKGSAINVKDKTFQRDWASFGADVTALELRLATTEEREWLNYCIEKDKYISYEDFLKEYKPTYKKGKWYKYKNWYIKFKKNDEGYFKSSEEIDNNRIYRKVNSTFGRVDDKEKVLLEDLKEIESYLPKGHPDIQQKPETFVGRYFKALVENAECSNIIKNNYYLIEQENDISFGFHVKKYPSFYELSKKDTKNYELMPIGWTPSDVVPEYVQLVKEHWSVDGEYVGEIFNLSDLSNLSKFKYAPTKNEFLKNINGWITQGLFKISDKKSYDLQNSKQYPLVPEECYDTEIAVGDDVEITINKYNHSPYKVGESFILGK